MIPMAFGPPERMMAAKANFDLLNAAFSSYCEAVAASNAREINKSRLAELEVQWHAAGLHG